MYVDSVITRLTEAQRLHLQGKQASRLSVESTTAEHDVLSGHFDNWLEHGNNTYVSIANKAELIKMLHLGNVIADQDKSPALENCGSAIIIARAWTSSLRPEARSPLSAISPDWLTLVSISQRYGNEAFFRDPLVRLVLATAAFRGKHEYLNLLLARSRSIGDASALTDALFAAIRGNSKPCVVTLLRAGANVSATRSGYGVLHVAAGVSDMADGILHALVQVGGTAVLSARDHRNWTPAHHAAIHGHRRIITALHAAGADFEAKTRSGRSVAAMALFAGDMELAQWIRNIEQGGRNGANIFE